MDFNLQDSSLQHKTTRLQKKKAEPHRESRSVKLQDELRGLKSRKPVEQTCGVQLSDRTRVIDGEGSVPSLNLKNYQKPWTNSKAPAVEVEELVKHMSNVPCYLQSTEQGNNVQLKALNFGVVDWGRLENWAYNQKKAVVRSAGDSPSIGDTSFSFSTFGSSTQSCQSIVSSPSRTKKTTSLKGHPSEGCRVKTTKEDKSRHVKGFHDSRTSPKGTSVRNHQVSETDCSDRSRHQHGYGRRKDSDKRTIACNMVQPPDSGFSTSNEYETANIVHDTVKMQDSRTRKAEKSDSYKQQNCSSNLGFTRESPEEQYFVLPKTIEGAGNHLQESVSRRCSGVDSTTLDDRRPVGAERNSFSANLLREGVRFTNPSPYVANSSPLLFTDHSDDRRPVGAERNSFSANLLREDIQFTNPSPYVPNSCPLFPTDQSDVRERSSTPVSEIGVPITTSTSKYGMQNQFIKESLVSEVDSLGQGEAEASTNMGREISPKSYSATHLDWVKRSSSLREGSSVGQKKWTACRDNSPRDKATAYNRGRRSPLRRILDPLLKSKKNIPEPTVASGIQNDHDQFVAHTSRALEESTSRHRSSKSIAAIIDFSTSQAKGSLNSSTQASVGSHDALQEERHVPSNRQAFLRRTWKNDMPMLMLSTNDSNILAATMREKSLSDKDNSECIYTISSIYKVKKKSGVWMSHGNKSTKHGLVSNVVGQLKVSSSKLISPNLKGHIVMRELVLLGAELMPASHEPFGSNSYSELAAIIIKTPGVGRAGTLGDVLKSGNCRDSSQVCSAEEKSSSCREETLQMEQNPNNLSSSSITALLPIKVHGFPAKGEPSTLIERWKSGGSCDCGGWDEGCIPTVLIDKVQENKNFGANQSFPVVNGTDQIELFVQGRTGENEHAFKMVGRNEGLYTVEFSGSIDLLQAFAICIATLYSGKLINPSPVHESVEAKSFQDHIFADSNTRSTHVATTSYVPQHPPLSPVGRA